MGFAEPSLCKALTGLGITLQYVSSPKLQRKPPGGFGSKKDCSLLLLEYEPGFEQPHSPEQEGLMLKDLEPHMPPGTSLRMHPSASERCILQPLSAFDMLILLLPMHFLAALCWGQKLC